MGLPDSVCTYEDKSRIAIVIQLFSCAIHPCAAIAPCISPAQDAGINSPGYSKPEMSRFALRLCESPQARSAATSETEPRNFTPLDEAYGASAMRIDSIAAARTSSG